MIPGRMRIGKQGSEKGMMRLYWVLILSVWAACSTQAQELSALARLDVPRSYIRDAGAGVGIQLTLSQPVPWRLVLLDQPPRLVLDFREVDFAGATGALAGAKAVPSVRSGILRPGWSRLVLELAGPMEVTSAAMLTDVGAVVQVALAPVSQARFGSLIGAADVAGWDLGAPAQLDQPMRRQTGEAPLVVVLDPGHGGIDPGAEQDGLSEAGLVLAFTRGLREAMLRAGMKVVMTREEDIFVPLETRISVARSAGADLFISLHADALAEGVARGATVYTLAASATDEASASLAERHDRAELLAGVDLSAQDDLIASVLMDLARADSNPRTDHLADALVKAIKAAKIGMHKHPRQVAAFSVLKSPDIPSVLLELGFLSSVKDLANLQDAGWHERMVGAIVRAVQEWAVADAAEAVLLRQ